MPHFTAATSPRFHPVCAASLDARPDLGEAGRADRVRQRIRFDLLPLLRDYVRERLLGPATSEVQGLADRIEARVGEARS